MSPVTSFFQFTYLHYGYTVAVCSSCSAFPFCSCFVGVHVNLFISNYFVPFAYKILFVLDITDTQHLAWSNTCDLCLFTSFKKKMRLQIVFSVMLLHELYQGIIYFQKAIKFYSTCVYVCLFCTNFHETHIALRHNEQIFIPNFLPKLINKCRL
jgi:hypothetical protein